jgi:hypothetical protein
MEHQTVGTESRVHSLLARGSVGCTINAKRNAVAMHTAAVKVFDGCGLGIAATNAGRSCLATSTTHCSLFVHVLWTPFMCACVHGFHLNFPLKRAHQIVVFSLYFFRETGRMEQSMGQSDAMGQVIIIVLTSRAGSNRARGTLCARIDMLLRLSSVLWYCSFWRH